jgi:hypothetical protein
MPDSKCVGRIFTINSTINNSEGERAGFSHTYMAGLIFLIIFQE